MNMLRKSLAILCGLSLICSPVAALAAPQDGQVVRGDADISRSGDDTLINQSSGRAVVNWRSFDIGASEAVRHAMPSADSAALHRVVGGGGASRIEGLLKSNGNIYIVNPAGVVIHNGARIETGGFAASTRDIADDNFMKGNMIFDRPGLPGAAIVNRGNITVRESGLAALVAPTVRNEGVIAARLGRVALASGDGAWTLDTHGDGLISFTVAEDGLNRLHAADGTPLGAYNAGSIRAEGGVVLLSAAQLDGVVSAVVNSGEISAASAEAAGGRIILKGDGADVTNSGRIDASSHAGDGGGVVLSGENVILADESRIAASSAQGEGGGVRLAAQNEARVSGTIAAGGAERGGTVVVTGGEVHVAGGAGIDASGGTGGGTVLLGGDAYGKGPEKNAANTSVAQSATIRADALRAGDGGQVVVWSDGRTIFDGTISARGGADNGDGGMVETSGHTLAVGNAASVDTSAPRGAFGEWLLDPADFVIAASGGDMSGTTLSANLNTTDVAILSSAGQSGANGDIFVNDAVTWNAGTTLTLSAYRDVNVNADITATGDAAGLVINTEILDIPGAADRSYSLASGARVTLSGANPSLSIFGRQYTVINTLEALQNMNQNLAGHYALGSDIDASATGGWNSGAGFMPVGTMNNSFSGIFDGLGHTITALTINRPSMDYVGLFGITGTSQIKHVCMMHPFITGRDRVGGLVGSNAGDIEECYSKEGDVKGAAGSSLNNLSRAGGLVGANLGSISRSHSTGKVTGGYYLGGLVGLNGGRIEESHSESTLTYYGAGGDFMGGLVGENQASGIISTSYSSGAITGDYYVGGLVGRNYGIISNSYSENDLTEAGELRQYFGGFVGGNLVLRNI